MTPTGTNKNTVLHYLILIIVALYIMVAIFDPANKVTGLKMPLFSLIIYIFLLMFIMQKGFLPNTLVIRILLLLPILFTFSSAIGVMNYGSEIIPYAISLIKGFTAILLVLPVVFFRLPYRKVFFTAIALMGITAIVLYLWSLLMPLTYNHVADFIVNRGIGRIGTRRFDTITLNMIFFVAMPLLSIPVPYFWNKLLDSKTKLSIRYISLLLIIIFVLAAYCSASRTLFLIIIIESFFCLVLLPKNKLIKVTILIFVCVASLIIFNTIGSTNMFSPDEKSNSIKRGHFESFVEHMNDDSLSWFIGKGLGSLYYTKGINDFTYQTELTYCDLIRYFGLLGTCVFLTILLLPLQKLYDWVLAISMFSYIFAASFNPILINSTGMLAICFFWSEQLLEHKINET